MAGPALFILMKLYEHQLVGDDAASDLKRRRKKNYCEWHLHGAGGAGGAGGELSSTLTVRQSFLVTLKNRRPLSDTLSLDSSLAKRCTSL